jgi:protein-tyrosine phosphatase
MLNNNRWLTKNYGSRSGFVKSIWYQFLYYSGYYRQYKNIDWSLVNRLVFVCKGNICRSAYAEAVTHSLGLEAISFGLDTIDNVPANVNAIKTAESMGLDLMAHKTTTVKIVELEANDLLIAMEPWQCERLGELFDQQYQCTLLGLWLTPALPYIYDPYGMSQSYFDTCFKRIQQGVQILVERLKK